MTTAAPRPPLSKRLLPIGIAALLYGVAPLVAFLGWAIWMESQQSGDCGTDCGRGYGLMFALGFGLLAAPFSAAIGAVAEFGAATMTRWMAHGTGGAIIVAAMLAFHKLMTNPFG